MPSWLSAMAAVAGVALTILGYNAVTGSADADPELAATTFVLEQTATRFEGEYRALDPERQTILVMWRAESDATWLFVEAEREPERRADNGTEDGRWEAVIPFAATPGLRWTPAIAQAALHGAGGSDATREIEELGPDADAVIWAAETRTIDP